MTTELTQHQLQALDDYATLMTAHPALFAGRTIRPIVTERATLVAYVRQHGTVLGVAAATPYALFVVDLVESQTPEGGVRRHPYFRLVSVPQLEGGVNVIVLATIDDPALGRRGDIVLTEHERHALGGCEIEVPRGFGERGLSGELNALRELEAETGFGGEKAYLLGSTTIDSGICDGTVSFYHVPVTRRTAPNREVEEAITSVRLVTRENLWAAIRSGEIRDGFTLQALALYERSSARYTLSPASR